MYGHRNTTARLLISIACMFVNCTPNFDSAAVAPCVTTLSWMALLPPLTDAATYFAETNDFEVTQHPDWRVLMRRVVHLCKGFAGGIINTFFFVRNG